MQVILYSLFFLIARLKLHHVHKKRNTLSRPEPIHPSFLRPLQSSGKGEPTRHCPNALESVALALGSVSRVAHIHTANSNEE